MHELFFYVASFIRLCVGGAFICSLFFAPRFLALAPGWMAGWLAGWPVGRMAGVLVSISFAYLQYLCAGFCYAAFGAWFDRWLARLLAGCFLCALCARSRSVRKIRLRVCRQPARVVAEVHVSSAA